MAPSFQQPRYPGVGHLYKGKMRDSIFGGATMPSYSPWDVTLQGLQADPDITYGSATIIRDLPPHPSRQTPIVNPPMVSAASIQPTPRDFYVFPSRSHSIRAPSLESLPGGSSSNPFQPSRRPPGPPGNSPPGTPPGTPPGGPQGGFPRGPPGGPGNRPLRGSNHNIPPPGPPHGPPPGLPRGPFGGAQGPPPQRPYQVTPFHFD